MHVCYKTALNALICTLQDSNASWDFVNEDNDPTPDYSAADRGVSPSHGTSCAGEVGMARDNGVCGAGVAYDCNIGGESYAGMASYIITRCNSVPSLVCK